MNGMDAVEIYRAGAEWDISEKQKMCIRDRLNGDGELKINTEAVKSIHFDFQSDKDNIKGTPCLLYTSRCV